MAVRRRTLGKKQRMIRRRTTRGGMGAPLSYVPTTNERETEASGIILGLDELISAAGDTPHAAGLTAQRKVIFDAEAIKRMSSLTPAERVELLRRSHEAYTAAYRNAGGT